MIISVAFLALALTVAGSQSGPCNYARRDPCINPERIGRTEFSWPPLFPGRVKLTHAAAEINGSERAHIDENDNGAKGIYPELARAQDTKSSLVAFWLEYDDADVSRDHTDTLMWTEMAVFYTNTSTEVGGAHNGCEKLLGNECIQRINSSLTWLYTEIKPISQLGSNYKPDEPLSGVCPDDLWGERQTIRMRNGEFIYGDGDTDLLLARDLAAHSTSTGPRHVTKVASSGNSSSVFGRTIRGLRPMAEQEGYAAVAVMWRRPGGSRLGRTPINLHLTTVCARLGSNASYSGQDNDDGRYYPSSGVGNASAGDVPPMVVTVVGLALGVVVGLGMW